MTSILFIRHLLGAKTKFNLFEGIVLLSENTFKYKIFQLQSPSQLRGSIHASSVASLHFGDVGLLLPLTPLGAGLLQAGGQREEDEEAEGWRAGGREGDRGYLGLSASSCARDHH